MVAIYACFKQDTHYLVRLNKYTIAFDQLIVHTEVVVNYSYEEISINELKEEIKHGIRSQVMMQCPTTWLEDFERAQ